MKNALPQIFLFSIGFGVLFSCQTFEASKKLLDVQSSASEVQSLEFKPKWVFDTLNKKNIGFRKVNFFTPFKYKNSIITANSLEGISSYELNSKNKKWELNTPMGIEAAGTLDSDKIYFGSLDGVFYSISAETGEVIWKFDSKAEIVAPSTVENGFVYFSNGANSLFCLDAKTGRQVWVYSRQELNSQMTIRGASKPVYSNGIIYSGFSDGSLVAVNAKTGTQQWEVLLNKNTRFKDIDATPVIDSDSIYISSYDDNLYSLSKSNGSIIWKYKAGGATAPLLVGQKLIISTSMGELISLNKKNGELLWKKKDINGIATEPISLNGLVLFGESQGQLKALDLLSGEEKVSFDPGKGIMCKLGTDGDTKIYFISGEANFYEVDLAKKTKGMIPFLVN